MELARFCLHAGSIIQVQYYMDQISGNLTNYHFRGTWPTTISITSQRFYLCTLPPECTFQAETRNDARNVSTLRHLSQALHGMINKKQQLYSSLPWVGRLQGDSYWRDKLNTTTCGTQWMGKATLPIGMRLWNEEFQGNLFHVRANGNWWTGVQRTNNFQKILGAHVNQNSHVRKRNRWERRTALASARQKI